MNNRPRYRAIKIAGSIEKDTWEIQKRKGAFLRWVRITLAYGSEDRIRRVLDEHSNPKIIYPSDSSSAAQGGDRE